MKITDRMGVTFDFTHVETHSVTSAENDSLRCTEITLYRTDTGKWVVYTVGASDVFHTSPTSCKTDATPVVASSLPESAASCPICNRFDIDPDPTNEVLLEKDRKTVIVCETADDVPKALTNRRNGQVYISRLSQTVMAKAGIETQVVQV